jgi:capsular exopolysaccharide synthesis family protein
LDAAASAAKLASSEVSLSTSLSSGGNEIAFNATAPTPSKASQAVTGAARAFVTLRARDIDAQAASFAPQLGALRHQLQSLDTQVAAAEGSSPGGGTSGTSVPSPLSTEISVVTSQYSALYTQWLQLQVAVESVRIAQAASSPSSVEVGGKWELAAIALGVGLIAGCGIALLRDLTQDRLSDAAELPELSRLPLLGELPVSRAARKRTIVEAFGGQLGETVRELRTALSLAPTRLPLKVVLVTSAATGEGKSFVAANLAVAWARSGARTVLVSSDLRHPSVERQLGVKVTGTSLPQALSERATDLDRLLLPTSVDELVLVPSGPLNANPAELLGSPAMAELLQRLRDRADIIILDSPPVLAVADALVLSSYADAVLLIVARGRSSKGSVARALRLLERSPTPVLGFVVNRATRSGLPSYPYFRAERTLNSKDTPAHHKVSAR